MKTAQKTKKLSEVKKLSKLRSLSLISLMSLVSLTPLQAQVKIGQDAAPVKGAVLELNSNTSDYIGGLRLTNVEITDIYVIPDEFSDKSFSEDDKLALKGAIVYNTNQYLQNELNELTGIGVYYWTGSKWVKETGGGTAIEPWNQVGTANQSFLNNQDSYLNAKVIIGEGADSKYFGAVNSEWAQLTVVGGDASINGIKVGTGRGNDHYNTAVGSGVLHTNEGGSHNSGLGIGALFSNTSGGENTALGANALGGNKTGNYNTAVGYQAFLNHSQSEGVMLDDGTGGWNTAIGAGTGSLGDSSTVVGTYALSSFSTGSRNTVLGMQAGRNIRKGSNNIAIGVNSYVPDGDANNQISIGNLIYGTGIGRNIWNDAAPGQGNVGIGTPAPQAKLDIAGQIQIQGGGPQENYVLTAVNEFGLAEWREPQGGSGAGSCLWEGMIGGNVYPKSYNTTKIVVGGTTPGLGSNAAQPWEPNSPAQFTVLGGDASINGLRVGRGGGQIVTNTIVGNNAILSNGNEGNNTAIGNQTLQSLGYRTSDNTAIGNQALMYLASDAYNNTAIGSRAGDQLHGGSNNILIGAGVQAPNDHASDQLAIGNFIYGTNGDTQANAKVGIGTNAPDTKLHISTGGTDTAPIAGFKLEDGTQGEGKVLTSDTNGVGTWRDATPPNPWVHIYTMTFPLEPVIKENEYYRFEKTDNWSHTDFPDGTYELALIADANGFYNLTVNLMANGEWVISYRPDGTKATMWSTVINKSTSVMQLHYKGSNMYAPYKHILEYLSGPTATPTESMSPPALKTTELGSYEAGTRFDIYIRRIH